jgi:lipopolysaccharide/colanic/teichoic acid biosynthesis glycosyltransferase
VPFQDPEVAGAKGVYRTRQKALIARFTQLEYEHKYMRMARQKRIDFIDTYSAAYRREIFLANGGFETFFTTASVEDQEFSFRLARKGYRLVFVPDAKVYHRHNATLAHYWRRKFGIGYWKTLLLRWHPERVVRDSHTPQTLKAQIGFLGLAGLLLLAALFWRALSAPALWAALACGGLFLLSAAPFLGYIVRRAILSLSKDRHRRMDSANLLGVALAAPFFLVVRALALGMGLLAGFLRFSIGWTLSAAPSPRQAPISGLNLVLKRVLDILVSVLGLILTAPILGLVALAIKLDSPGPVFFVQERAGENGRPFRCIKLRTMVDGAEAMLPELVDLDALAASPAFKLKDDPRVTSVGRFLRRTGLDEVPQLWNVLRGEMSLVGPRPEEMRIVRLYNDWHRRRLAVKPGITGPMQVSGRGDLDLDERVRLELDYIHNYSLWKDLNILARTVGAVISGRGAY